MGFSNPERAQEAMGALEMMEFEGIDKVREQVQQGQTLLNICRQMSQQMDQMAALLQALTGKDMGVGAVSQGGGSAQGGGQSPGSPAGGGNSLASAVTQAQTPMTGYGQRLAARSKPDMNVKSSAAAPKA